MYSQHKEDEWIENYLTHSKLLMHKFIVDIGAGDGIFLSNSRMLIDKYSFDALLVEPSDYQYFMLADLYRLHAPQNSVILCEQAAVAGEKYKYKIEKNGHWTI